MRLPPLAPDSLDPERRRLHDDMAAMVAQHLKGFVSTRRDGALVGPFPPMLHVPQFGGPAWAFTRSLIEHATLPRAVREVAILATGARFRSRYELYAHEVVAEQAGLAPATIATLAAGQRPADLDQEQAIAFDVASALVSGMTLPASLHARACAAFGTEGLAELVYLVGGYCLVSLLLNAFDVPVPGRDGDAAP